MTKSMKRIQPEDRYTLSTRSLGDGSEACYVVYHKREIVATFPVNNPAESTARNYALRFIATAGLSRRAITAAFRNVEREGN